MAEAEPGSREATFPEQPRVDEHGPGIPWSSWCLRVGERAGLPGAGAALAEALALAAGRGAPWAPDEVRRWRRFAELLAEPVGIAEALARLWLDPDAPDLDEPARTPLLALWLGEPALAAPLTLALAGERSSPARRYEIHCLAATAPFRAAVASATRRTLDAARAALPGGALGAAAAAFVDALAERCRFFDDLMAARELLTAARPPAARDPRREAAEDLAAAIAWLEDAAPWRESWEVQRFGVLGSGEVQVGQWFVRGTILLALRELGRDVRPAMAALLEEIPPGDLRYYGAGCRLVPPDADDLGLMLELAAITGAASARAESWIALMLANVRADGSIPTWFERGPAGRTWDGPTWSGGDCPAVRLHLLRGLLAFDPARFDALIQANAALVLAAAGPDGIAGAYHYEGWYAALALHRFGLLYRERAASRPLRAELDRVEAALRARAASEQRLDGGWGSPLRTAAALEGAALAATGGEPTAAAPLLERGARWLGERQLVDGAWPEDPWYRVPMKRGREGRHGGRALSTALCARALGRAAAALGAAGGATA